ncbi:hypothetical protein [Aquimarina megaterium]|uniref:hypothetical protein n=1 Tax=Aquimarina megaterium TaxID=1443666 RepID=UPI0009429177|nr:hypothetical protein [Aquimarina megaterium]
MNGIDTLQNRSNANIITDHYIHEVLESAAEEIHDQQSRVIANANSNYQDLLDLRSYTISSGTLTLTHALRERFVDMKRIKGKSQKSLEVHNQIIWSQFNVIIGKLRYGFTQDIRNSIAGKFNIDM